MTVEVKSEETQMAETVVSKQEESAEVIDVKVDTESTTAVEKVEAVEGDAGLKKGEEPIKEEAEKTEGKASPRVEKSSSYKEESNFLSDLKESEKKALAELKAKVEEAILENSIFKKEEEKAAKKEEAKPAEGTKEVKEEPGKDAEAEVKQEGEEKEKADAEKEKPSQVDEEKLASDAEKNKSDVVVEEEVEEINKDISIWGVPLLPSKGSESTDVVLLKFLRARDFKVNEAFEMLRSTLKWRKESKIDSILDEELGSDLSSVAYMNGIDREGHPVCYNIYGVFEDDELYQKTFGTEEKREQFLRWRIQLMEKGIQKLNLQPGGVVSLLQINDLKNSPGPSKKDLRVATKQAVALLQDSYPEFVARNVFINVPFWYYAFNAILSPFLTQRTKSKFVFARPARVTETLLKYIAAEHIPVHYGGLKRENDTEFSAEDGGVSELIVKSGTTQTVQIPATEVGSTVVWDLMVLGWEVNYKEEFVPTDEGSYTIIIQKSKKMGSNEEPIRNSFRITEPGKVVLTIENSAFKKKRAMYRYKVKSSS